MNQYERLVQQNKELQGELALANKVIELMTKELSKIQNIKKEYVLSHFEYQAKQKLISLTK